MPAPDVSGPSSLGEVFKMFTPAGADHDALLAALKKSQMPSVPLSDLGKAAQSAEGMRWCKGCQRPVPAYAECCPDQPEPAMPPDPSPPDLMAGFAINDMIEAMVAGGRPLESAERIVGAMLAAHGIMSAERDAID